VTLDLASFGEGEVCLEFSGQVATLTFSNPEVHNALSGRMMCQLEQAVSELERFDGSVVVLRGAGQSFCSGADLRVVGQSLNSREAGEHMSSHMQRVLGRLRNLPLVSVALVEGVAYGGGAEIITACDHRLVARTARIRFVQAKMGVSVGWGGGARLVGLVGRESAIRLMTTASVVSPDDAKRIGLATKLFVEGEAESALAEFVDPILRLPAAAVRANKAALCPPLGSTDEQVLAHERAIFSERWVSPERAVAMEKFK
jgi:ethylmalonyl-CoA/methylmalonyl-CoA decarboxylase